MKRSMGRSQQIDLRSATFSLLMLASLLFTLSALFALLIDVILRGAPVLFERGGNFLSSSLSSSAASAGIFQGLLGSAILVALVAAIAFPLGIATAIYLEEYAGTSIVPRIIRVNIRNLSGVPSVVYGLLGLAVFVPLLGRSALAGGATLAVLVLPIVVITASEALRAVPHSLREAGYGIGASPWEVTRRLVLPAAAPSILTGMILALTRALGETAPLVVAGAVLGSFSGVNAAKMLTSTYTALPVIIYDWSRRPQEAFREDAAAAIIVLLFVVLTISGLAVVLRRRFDGRHSA
ncbi:MAG: phosphate ABC transporter permease PstA [Candidatus Limnocylindrus sp.]